MNRGDTDGFVAAIQDLIGDKEERYRLGKNGREYVEQYFNKENILERFERDLMARVREHKHKNDSRKESRLL